MPFSDRLRAPVRVPCLRTPPTVWRALARFAAGLCILGMAGLGPRAVLAQPMPPKPLESAGSGRTTALTLDEAVQAATRHSRALAGYDGAVAAAQHSAVAAGQLPDPMLGLSLQNVPLQGAQRGTVGSDFMTLRSVSVMQRWTRQDKRDARQARLLREADGARAEQLRRQAEVQREAAWAWLQLWAHHQRVGRIAAQRAEAALQAQAAEAAYRGLRGSQGDVLLARAEAARWAEAGVAADADLLTAQRTLARWTGMSAPAVAAADLPAEGMPWQRADAALADAAALAQTHPELQVWDARQAMAQADAEIARAELRPDWTGELMLSRRGDRYADMVSIGVSVPLQWRPEARQERELAARLALLEQVDADRAEAQRAVALEVDTWQLRWQAQLAQLRQLRAQRLPLVQQRVDAALAAYQAGQGALAGVLEARRAVLTAELEALDLELEAARTWARLAYLQPRGAAMTAPSSRFRSQP